MPISHRNYWTVNCETPHVKKLTDGCLGKTGYSGEIWLGFAARRRRIVPARPISGTFRTTGKSRTTVKTGPLGGFGRRRSFCSYLLRGLSDL